MPAQATTRGEPLVLTCTLATARGMATATVLDLAVSPAAICLLLLGTLSSVTSYLDVAVLRGAFATGVVFLTILLAQYWLTMVNACRLRAAPGAQLMTSYRGGRLVVSGDDGELFFAAGSVRVRRLAGMTLLKRRRRPPVVVPSALVTGPDVEFLTRQVPADPPLDDGLPPASFSLGIQDHDNLVRTARGLYLRGGAVGYLISIVLVVAVRALLHESGALWWVALFAYLAFLGWLAVGRATAAVNPIGAQLDVMVSDDALELTDSFARRIVRFADVRSLAIHHEVLVLRRRGIAPVLVPRQALPEDAFTRMRAAFAALES